MIPIWEILLLQQQAKHTQTQNMHNKKAFAGFSMKSHIKLQYLYLISKSWVWYRFFRSEIVVFADFCVFNTQIYYNIFVFLVMTFWV